MTWRSFVDFWIMREMGQEDAILRNYDVLRHSGNGSATLCLALKRIGIPCPHMDEGDNYIAEVRQKLADFGIPKPEHEHVRIRLIGWYNWDRIRKGDIQQWFMSQMVRGQRG